MSKKINLSIIWHLHQPTFVPTNEIHEKTIESYMNILHIHEELKIPFALNITGSLLERLLNLEPEFLDQVRSLEKKGLIELLGSAYYHPVLPLLPYEHVKIQIEKDLNIKREIFNTPIRGFWPTELAWAPWLIPIIKKIGLEWVILDSSALILSNTLPEWEYRNVQGIRVLIPELKTLTLKQEIYQPYFTEFLNEKLSVILRDHEMSTYLTEFKKGVIYNDSLIKEYTTKIIHDGIKGGLTVIADDGEKITPQTAWVYKKLLEDIKENDQILFCKPTEFLNTNPPKEGRYFPSSTFQYGLDAWIKTMDDKMYLIFLDRIRERVLWLRYLSSTQKSDPKIEEYLKKAEELLLKAEDSSCFFWRFLKRTRMPCYEYVYTALKYINKGLRVLKC